MGKVGWKLSDGKQAKRSRIISEHEDTESENEKTWLTLSTQLRFWASILKWINVLQFLRQKGHNPQAS